MLPYNKKLVQNARTLRKNMTPEEKHLWYDFLKKLPCSVRRQHNIESYILDFYIAEQKIAIEVDGRQYLTDAHAQADAQRDEKLALWGITVLRYSNDSIRKNFNSVTADILSKLHLDYNSLQLS